MMKRAVKGRKGFKVSTIELQRRGISYTVDTLRAFKRRYPTSEITLIIGADNLAQFHSWKFPNTILKLASLAVYKRTGFKLLLNKCDINFILLKGRMLRISSTEIRNKIERGFPIQALVPGSIVLYIKQHSLYSTGPHPPTKRQFHENHRVV
jgi:nicotinate-nucleotide adenylyltransferase